MSSMTPPQETARRSVRPGRRTPLRQPSGAVGVQGGSKAWMKGWPWVSTLPFRAATAATGKEDSQSPKHREEQPRASRRKHTLVLGLLLSLCCHVLYREFRETSSVATSNVMTVATIAPAQVTATHQPYQYIPCRVEESSRLPENITRFQVTPVEEWKCRQEVSDNYWLVFADFQIKECPPKYSSSTFQLEGSTSHSRIMGQISGRYHFKNGCGLYNASVAIMDHAMPMGESQKTVNMELFWTSEFQKYSNQLHDIQDAHTIKTENLNTTQIQSMFTPERLRYLQRHLQPLFQRQLQIFLTKEPQPQKAAPFLPDCANLPISEWSPVGVFEDPTYSETSPYPHALSTEKRQWPFRSARCRFPARPLNQLNDLYAGIRIWALSDSHGNGIMDEVRAIQCPELTLEDTQVFFEKQYDCPYRNNSWVHAYRFFRGVYMQDLKTDFDGMSSNLRHGSPDSCQQILGLGLHNVTILSIPQWLFVYETQEGLDDFVLSLKSLIMNCRESHEELMKDHIVLLQAPSARDYLPFGVYNGVDLNPAHSWRGIHNHRLEAFTRQIERELGPYVDGIIPTFGMTFARMKTDRTRDGVHLPSQAYREIFHVQMAAVRSAFKYKRGLDLPLMKRGDPQARWFANQPLE